MPFTAIYTRSSEDLPDATPHYPDMGREVPWAWEMANRKWDLLMEEYPQYEKYKMYIVPFWAGTLSKHHHWLRALTMSEMVKSVEEIIEIIRHCKMEE